MSFKEAAGRGRSGLWATATWMSRRWCRLERSGYSGWYVLEQDTVVETEPDEGEGPAGDVRKSLAYLQRRLERTA